MKRNAPPSGKSAPRGRSDRAGASSSGRMERNSASKSSKAKKQQSMVAPGQRQLRVGERMRHILADVLRRGDLYDPALANASMITVTAVDIGADLKNAVAFIMPLGGKDAEAIVEALNRATGYFRTAVGSELDLRHAPKISFRIDHSYEQVAHIENLLRSKPVKRDITEEADQDEE